MVHCLVLRWVPWTQGHKQRKYSWVYIVNEKAFKVIFSNMSLTWCQMEVYSHSNREQWHFCGLTGWLVPMRAPQTTNRALLRRASYFRVKQWFQEGELIRRYWKPDSFSVNKERTITYAPQGQSTCLLCSAADWVLLKYLHQGGDPINNEWKNEWTNTCAYPQALRLGMY